MWRKKKPKIDFNRRFGSFAFFFSIPVMFLGSYYILASVGEISKLAEVDHGQVALFIYGLVLAAIILLNIRAERLRTFIHEAKHAFVVVLCGNKVTEFRVDRGTGHVVYETEKSKLHFEPFVILAPYYFPLLSLPALIGSLFVPISYMPLAAFFTGLALAIDILTNYHEFDPRQSDLQRIYGGVFASRLFIVGANIFWFAVILLWLVAGLKGFIYVGATVLQALDDYVFVQTAKPVNPPVR